jgi:hypothetical protein
MRLRGRTSTSLHVRPTKHRWCECFVPGLLEGEQICAGLRKALKDGIAGISRAELVSARTWCPTWHRHRCCAIELPSGTTGRRAAKGVIYFEKSNLFCVPIQAPTYPEVAHAMCNSYQSPLIGLTRIPQSRRNPVDRDVNAALGFLITVLRALAFAVAANQLHLQMMQWVDVGEAVAHRSL